MSYLRVLPSLTLAFAACTEAPTSPERTTVGSTWKYVDFEQTAKDVEAEAAEQRGFAERTRAIEAEIEEHGESHAWAGTYYAGNGFGDNVCLWLAPSGRFVAERYGCVGYYEPNLGLVRERDGRLELSFSSPNHRSACRGFDGTLLVIPWGQRRYLVDPERMLDFANDFNEDANVSNFHHLMRIGDESRPVSGKPRVPAEFEKFFLDAPLDARVVELTGSRIECFKDWEYTTALVRVDVGAEHGAFVGMWLRVTNPPLGHCYRVIELEEFTSIAARSLYAHTDPEIGWALSTKN